MEPTEEYCEQMLSELSVAKSDEAKKNKIKTIFYKGWIEGFNLTVRSLCPEISNVI